MPAVTPATGLTSVRAMSARERPFRPHRRPEPERVVDRAGQTDTAHQPDQARRVAELRGEDRTDQGTRAAMAAKWWPKRTHRVVGK